MGSISRHSTIKRRRNFLPTLLLVFVFWALIATVIYFLDPLTSGVIFLFFFLFFFAVLFTTALIFGNRRRGFILTISLTIFILLRYFGIGNVLNFLLIVALATTIELYLAKK